MHHKTVRVSLWLGAEHTGQADSFSAKDQLLHKTTSSNPHPHLHHQTQLTDLFSWAKEKMKEQLTSYSILYGRYRKAELSNSMLWEHLWNYQGKAAGKWESCRGEKDTSKRIRRTSHQINPTTNASLTQHQSLRHTKDMVDLSVNSKSWWYWKGQQKQKLGVCWGNQ